MPGNVFISYRREDTAGYAGRLYDRLKAAFPGRVFIDVGEIPPGADFVKAIEQHIAGCGALIALIGPNWAAHERLRDPADFVRLETASALKRNTTVIPVLVGGGKLPPAATLPEDIQPLLRHQTISISDEDWDHGCKRLIQALQTVVGAASKRLTVFRLRGISVFFGVVLVVGVLGGIVVRYITRPAANTSQASPATLPESTRAAENYDKSVARGYDNAAKAMDDVANKIGGTDNVAAPSITSISPDNAAPGALVTLTGSNFGARQGTGVVNFVHEVGGHAVYVAAPVRSWSPTSISVQVPSIEPGQVWVLVQLGALHSKVEFTVRSP